IPGASLVPGAVTGLRASKNVPSTGFVQFSWSSLDPALGAETSYDVARGILSVLRSGGFPGGAICASNDLPDTPYMEDASACGAGPGDGCWYLVRGQNGCGPGTYEAAALDSSGPCP